jgi:protein-serine/threonine kinase
VVNNIRAQGSSIITVAAKDNVRLSTTEGIPDSPENSTIRWGGGLVAHPEQVPEDEAIPLLSENSPPLPEPKSAITPCLATLEKAVSARIYFENLYFPHPFGSSDG